MSKDTIIKINKADEEIGVLRIVDNSDADLISADKIWEEQLKEIVGVINKTDEIPLIGGTNVNKLGSFTMMDVIKKGDYRFPEAVLGYIKTKGLIAKIK